MTCARPQRLLAAVSKMKGRRTRKVPKEVAADFKTILSALREGSEMRRCADPVFWHPGDGVAADASSNHGWGVVAGPWIFHGLWSRETLEACEAIRRHDQEWTSAEAEETPGTQAEERVFLSPLELLAQAFVVRVVRERLPGEVPNGNFYSRCDNDSAVRVVAAGRAKSPAMTEALRIVKEEERGGIGGRGYKLRLEHLGTLDNKVAGLLSRGALEEAREQVRARWGVCLEGRLDPEFVAQAEERVRKASLRDEALRWEAEDA